MNKHIKKYRRIVDKLIDKDFSKLKRKWIIITEINLFNLKYSAILFYFLFFSWIAVHSKVRKYSKDALKALFAHEFAHLNLIEDMNFFAKIKFMFIWLFSKKVREKFERDADILTIKKGYGKERLKFEKESRKTYTQKQLKRRRKGYLTPHKIKFYIKKFKK